MNETIQTATVPGTTVTILVEKGRNAVTAEPWFYVTREPNGATFVNYLSRGCETEAEARETANFLWRDTVARRNSYNAVTEGTAEQANAAYNDLLSKPQPVEVTEGYWKANGSIFKVQQSQSSGHLYAKRLVVEGTDGASWEYAPGMMPILRLDGHKLSEEEAAEFGKLYGICAICGRTLTNEVSIERGIGPVCADKQGW